MPLVGFEPTIPASERAKTVHALDRAVTMTGYCMFNYMSIIFRDATFDKYITITNKLIEYDWCL
jgi:hypothetical protein